MKEPITKNEDYVKEETKTESEIENLIQQVKCGISPSSDHAGVPKNVKPRSKNVGGEGKKKKKGSKKSGNDKKAQLLKLKSMANSSNSSFLDDF